MKKNSYSVRGGFLRNAKRALLTLAISSAALPASADVFQQIIDNVVASELSTSKVSSLVASAKEYKSSMKDNGSWSDVDYASHSQTNWPAMKHLNRLKALAVKEKQMARQVELNLEIKRLESEETHHLGLLRTEKA